MKTINDIRKESIETLILADIPSSSLCVDILLAFVLGYPSIHHVIVHAKEEFPCSLFSSFSSLLMRASQGEPLAYIVNHKYFLDSSFIVNKNTLIPRPETEELVQLVLQTLAENTDSCILDIGTGSGCIACSIAQYYPKTNIFALDISFETLLTANENIKKHNISGILLQADLYELPFQKNSFSHIIANPPYLSEYEYTQLHPSVAQFEPYHALVAGKTGLEAIFAIIYSAYELLQDKGKLFLEIGHLQKESILKFVKQQIWYSFECMQDISGKDRFIILQK